MNDSEQTQDLTADFGTSILGPNPSEVLWEALELCGDRYFAEYEFESEHEIKFMNLLKSVFCVSGTIFPATTGGEAIDLAIRISRLLTNRKFILHLSGSYHGVTLGASSICGIDGWTKEIETQPIGKSILFDETGNVSESTRRRIEIYCQTNSVACLVMEPIFGNYGFLRLDSDSISWIKHLCRQHGIILIADEILTGLGRCGEWSSSKIVNLEPDFILIGKALGAGISPISAVLTNCDLDDIANRPAMRSTYSWTPFSCAVGTSVINRILRHNLVARVKELRKILDEQIWEIEQIDLVKKVHGSGLAMGIEFHDADTGSPTRLRISRQLLKNNIVVAPNPNIRGIMIFPSLNITENTLKKCMSQILCVLKEDSGLH